VAVKPDADYILVETNQGNLILAKERQQVLDQLNLSNYKVLKEFKGKEIVGTKYEHPLLELISGLKKIYEKEDIHRIVGADFVDLTTGTGIVHLSPGNGEEDFNVGVQEGLSIFSPFDGEAKFTEEAGYFSGMFARDADDVVIKLLDEKGLLVKKEKVEHLYPTCWRSHHRLIFIARREYYLWTNKIVDNIVKAAEKVEYFYEEPKNRFISILKEGKPWCISRERYWGTPLPIFVCEKCGHKRLVSSRKEIVENAIELPDGPNFELHRPWIDKIKLRCEKCGGIMHREPFVLDTWHNSGAAPLASFSDEEFSYFVPVDFLTEGIDQTRGWANRLLLLNVILKGKPEPPYKAFLFQGHVLDELGRKMSKSLGNVVDSEEMIDKYSADLYRFYLVWKASPIESMSFSEKEIMERPFQVLSTFFNLCKFFFQNAKYDNYSWDRFSINEINPSDLSYADKWVLSKTQKLIVNVTNYIDRARYHHALRELENFIINTLSRMYIPSIRQEFWFEEDERKIMTKYATLFYILLTVAKLMNPITPFISEYVYQKVFKQFSSNLELSINLEEWPKYDKKFLFKEEKTMDLAFKVIPVILYARQKAGVKRRWPLRKATLAIEDSEVLEELKKARNIIELLSNVKEIDFVSNKKDLNLKLEISPDLQKLGPKYKEKLGDIVKEVKNNEKQIAHSLLESGKATIFLNNMQIQLTNEDVKITYLPPDETVFVEDTEKKISVLLSKKRDETLLAEGILRDIARRIQDARKRAGLNPPEIIEQVVLVGLDDETRKLMHGNLQELAKLVRAKEVIISENLPPSSISFDYDFEGFKLRIGIKSFKS
ncbi:MAG: class I tRNA ligase family protein, partial [Thermoproteota archaeon]